MSKEKNYNIEPWYEVIMGEIMRVSELTAEFLQFSKPHIMNFRVHSFNDCVQRAINLLESESFMQGHQLTYRTAAATLMISMDKDKMVQLLVNLVKNSFEAMHEKGQVVLELSRENEQVRLLIRDTGEGIPKAHLSKIFDPFFTTKENGTGLGLAICHKIVQDHRGTISVSSSQEGTTFELLFPLAMESAQLIRN
jgi:signal transduction histidine kinase